MEQFICDIIGCWVTQESVIINIVMEEIRKIAKNQNWFRPIVERARINYKNLHKLADFDENKLSRE